MANDSKSVYKAIMREVATIRAASSAANLIRAYGEGAMHLEACTIDADDAECSGAVFEYLYRKLINTSKEVKALRGFQF